MYIPEENDRHAPDLLKPGQLNKLLQRQLEQFLSAGETIPPHLEGFLQTVSETYENFEKQLPGEEIRSLVSQQIGSMGTWELTLDSQNPLRGQLDWSEEMYGIFGYTKNEVPVTLELYFAHLLPADKRLVEATLGQMIVSGEDCRMEHWLIRKDGSECFVCQRGTLVRDEESGEPLRLIAIVHDITDQKRAQEEIQNKETHLGMTQRIARVGSWEMGLQQPLNSLAGSLRLSDECYRILGYEPGEIVPDVNVITSHLHPEDRKRVHAVVGEAMAASSPFEVECRVITRQGQLLHVVGRGEIIINGLRNKPVKVIGILQDVTEQKRASLSLEEAKANFKNILENTDTAFVLLDAERRILLFNRQADELTKREAGNTMIIGAKYEDIVLPGRKEIVRQALEGVALSKQKLVYESHYANADRPECWFSVSIHPIVSENDELIGMSVATHEITNEKNHLEQIKVSNERYELVTRATKDVIWDWNLMDDMVYRSNTFIEVFGGISVADEMLKDGWIEQVHEEDQARVHQHMMSCIEDPRANVWEDEYRFYRKNGELAYVSDRGLIIRNSQGQAERMVGAMRDITTQTLLEKERDKITNDLLQRNVALEQFTYIVSHNLRGPVANILGLSGLLKSSALDEQSFQMCLTSMESTTKKLDQVIKDLDQVLQVRQQLTQTKEKISLRGLVEEIQLMIGHEQGHNDIWINIDFSKTDEVYSLKSYLHSIFHNLITNSVKYRKRDQPLTIDIKSDQSNGYTLLTFKDNGTGIDLKTNGEKVFGLYKRFHESVEGKGIGLFMTKTQVESLGGRIHLQSEPGGGTEFTVELPLH
mgnify:FL=1|tara:strand:- start:269674 stop:272136 length:2463 start_codon:yes stop_codon:yes gene_type:complete